MGVVRRLGVFGGTFDPVHNGHLIVAEAAGESLALDEVLFIPAGSPRLKDREDFDRRAPSPQDGAARNRADPALHLL